MPESLPIQHVHHISRATADAEKSIAFYRDVLGFYEIQRPGFNFRGAWMFNYGVQIHIIENPEVLERERPKLGTRANHVAFHVDDIDVSKQRLEEHDVTYHEQVNAGGIHQIFFQDPDGNIIELAVYGPTPEKL